VIEVRSYRRVFDLERRIYRVDRLRLNPAGIPVRGAVYLLAILAATLLVARVPLIGVAVDRVPWPLRVVALPAGAAALLAVMRIDGRPFHLAAQSMLRFRLGLGVPVGLPTPVTARRGRTRRWTAPPLLMVPDGCDGAPRLRYTGPGAVRVSVAHELSASRAAATRLRLRPHLRVRHRPGARRPREGTVILLRRGARMSVR
jgi:hypothetical protein